MGSSETWILTLALAAGPALAAAGGEAATKEPGIYLETDKAESPALVKLEPTTMSRTGTKDLGKTMATSMLTGGMFGGKPKAALYFPGARASLRAPAQAYFRFYFDPKAAAATRPPGQPANAADMMAAALQQMDTGDSGLPAGTKHPQDFALVRLQVKNDERQMVVNMEMKAQDPLPIRIRSVPDGYRVFTDRPLEPGEYGFFTMPKKDGTGGGDKLWEFGVDPQ